MSCRKQMIEGRGRESWTRGRWRGADRNFTRLSQYRLGFIKSWHGAADFLNLRSCRHSIPMHIFIYLIFDGLRTSMNA
jgi:hypothetical protein